MEGGEEGSDVELFALLPVIDLQVVRIHVLKTFMLKTPCQNFSNTFEANIIVLRLFIY